MRSRHVLARTVLAAAVAAAAISISVAFARAGTVAADAIASVVVTPLGGASENGTVTTNANGSVAIVVPYRAIGLSHHVEMRDGAGAVVDSVDVVVPAGNTPVKVITQKGVSLTLLTSHSGGPNGAPSSGSGEYTPTTAVTSAPAPSDNTTPDDTPTSDDSSPTAMNDEGGADRTGVWAGITALGTLTIVGGIVVVARTGRPVTVVDAQTGDTYMIAVEGCDCDALRNELQEVKYQEGRLLRLIQAQKEWAAELERTATKADREAAKLERLLARHDADLQDQRRADLEEMIATAKEARSDAAQTRRAISANEDELASTRARMDQLLAELVRCGCPEQVDHAQSDATAFQGDDFFDNLFDGLMALDRNATKVVVDQSARPHTVSGTPLNPVGKSVADDPEYMKQYGGVPEPTLDEKLHDLRENMQRMSPGVYVAPISYFKPDPPKVSPRKSSAHQALVALEQEKARVQQYIRVSRTELLTQFLDTFGLDRGVNYANHVIARIDTEIADFKADTAAGGADWAACRLWWDREQQWQAYKYAIQHCFMEPVQYAFGVYGGVQGWQQSASAGINRSTQQQALKLRRVVNAHPPTVKPITTKPTPSTSTTKPTIPTVSRSAAEAKVLGKLGDNRPMAHDSAKAIANRGENCPYTSMQTAERLRGGEVSPVAPPFKHTDGIGLLQNHFGNRFVPASPNMMNAYFGSKPSGTQGIVYVAWKNPSGGRPMSAHVFNVVNQDGHVIYVDGQTGRPFQGWQNVDPAHTQVLIIK